MPSLPRRLFDAGHHYYEALDAFTRHLPPRTVRWAEIDGRKHHLHDDAAAPTGSRR